MWTINVILQQQHRLWGLLSSEVYSAFFDKHYQFSVLITLALQKHILFHMTKQFYIHKPLVTFTITLCSFSNTARPFRMLYFTVPVTTCLLWVWVSLHRSEKVDPVQ